MPHTGERLPTSPSSPAIIPMLSARSDSRNSGTRRRAKRSCSRRVNDSAVRSDFSARRKKRELMRVNGRSNTSCRRTTAMPRERLIPIVPRIDERLFARESIPMAIASPGYAARRRRVPAGLSSHRTDGFGNRYGTHVFASCLWHANRTNSSRSIHDAQAQGRRGKKSGKKCPCKRYWALVVQRLRRRHTMPIPGHGMRSASAVRLIRARYMRLEARRAGAVGSGRAAATSGNLASRTPFPIRKAPTAAARSRRHAHARGNRFAGRHMQFSEHSHRRRIPRASGRSATSTGWGRCRRIEFPG